MGKNLPMRKISQKNIIYQEHSVENLQSVFLKSPLFQDKLRLSRSLHSIVPTADLDDVTHPADTAEYPLALHISLGIPVLDGHHHTLGQHRQPVVRCDDGLQFMVGAVIENGKDLFASPLAHPLPNRPTQGKVLSGQ